MQEEKYFYKVSDKYYLYSAILVIVGLILTVIDYKLFFVLGIGIILLITKIVSTGQFMEIDKNGIRTNKFNLSWNEVKYIIYPCSTTSVGSRPSRLVMKILTQDKTYNVPFVLDGGDKMIAAIRKYYKGKIESYMKK